MSLLGADYRRDMGVHSYPVLVYALTPLAALVLQAWLPRLVLGYTWFDLPLVVTVYFALARRNPIQGTLMGAGWASLRMRSPTMPSGSTALPRRWPDFWPGRWGAHRRGEPHHPHDGDFSAFAAVERDLLLDLSRFAGAEPGMELAGGAE